MRGRWLVAILIVSVALNLFLIGAGAGVIALGARMAHQSPPASRGTALFWATDGLPQPDRRDMRQMLRSARDDLKPESERSLALRIAAWGTLADPKPDAAAIEAKLTQSRQADIDIRTRFERRIIDYAVRMPLADRRIFAEGMRRALTPRQPAPAAATVAPTTAVPTNAAAAHG